MRWAILATRCTAAIRPGVASFEAVCLIEGLLRRTSIVGREGREASHVWDPVVLCW